MQPYPQTPRKNRRAAWIALAILLAVIVAWRMFFSGGAGQQAGMQMPPPAVTVQEVTAADIPLTFEYAGRTAGSREVEIRARVSGILLQRAYTEGQTVKKGDVLFKIDPAAFEAALAQAQARLTQAERDWERANSLYKEQAISAREYDQARATHEQAQAEVKTARINLGYTTVEAPIGGVTSEESVSEGSLVAADTTLLTRLAQLDPIYVNFAYPDAEAIEQRRQLAEGKLTLPPDKKLTAELHFGDGSVYPETGTVNFTDSLIDPQTGTVRARAVLSNKARTIFPGQFVRVVIKGFTARNAIAIPDQAVMQGPQGPFVFVVTPEGKAAVKPVTLGLLNGKNRLIEGGLATGDKIITEGMIKVRPDAPVSIAPPPGESAPAPAEKAEH